VKASVLFSLFVFMAAPFAELPGCAVQSGLMSGNTPPKDSGAASDSPSGDASGGSDGGCNSQCDFTIHCCTPLMCANNSSGMGNTGSCVGHCNNVGGNCPNGDGDCCLGTPCIAGVCNCVAPGYTCSTDAGAPPCCGFGMVCRGGMCVGE